LRLSLSDGYNFSYPIFPNQPMINFKKYPFGLSFVLLFTSLTIVSCASNGTSISDADIQATVNAAVQATTESLEQPLSTLTPIPAATTALTAPIEEAVAAESSGSEELDESTIPPTETATATETPLPPATSTPELAFYQVDQADGTIRYELTADRFGITLPADWLVADLTETADSSGQSELEEILGSSLFQGLVASGLKFYAINWSAASQSSPSPANINMAVQPADGITSLSEFGPLAVEQLIYQFDLSPDEVGQSSITISDLPALRVDYFREIQTPTGDQINLQVVQYIVIVNDTIYRIIITLPAELAPALLPDAESAVQNMTFYSK
jgi:hypothetical protein